MTVLKAKCEPEPAPSRPKASLTHPLIRSKVLRLQMGPHVTHYQAYSTHTNLSILISNGHPFCEWTLVNIFNHKRADNLNHDHLLLNGFLISHSAKRLKPNNRAQQQGSTLSGLGVHFVRESCRKSHFRQNEYRTNDRRQGPKYIPRKTATNFNFHHLGN